MKYTNCTNCGHENPMKNKFCVRCGVALPSAASAQSNSRSRGKKAMLAIGIGLSALVLLCLLFFVPKFFSDRSGIASDTTPVTGVCTVVYQSSNGATLGTTSLDYVCGATDTVVPPSFSGYVTPDTQVITWDSTDTAFVTFLYTPAAVSYTVVYSSSNGTVLGTATAELLHGTTNTITPPDFEGYATPDVQTAVWDSVNSNTVTFTYAPVPVSNEIKSGNISADPARGLSYSAEVEYQNHTAESVQLRIKWTTTLSGSKIYNSFSQRFIATAESVNLGPVVITEYGHWKDPSPTPRSASVYSDWITVPLGTTNATTVDLSIYYYQVNKNGIDVTQRDDAAGLNTVWTVNIPAY